MYHLFFWIVTDQALLPLLPICVRIPRYPSLWVNIAGALSPKLQQSLSVVVRRSSSAHAPFFMLGGVKEWTFRCIDMVKDGPQVDIVDIVVVVVVAVDGVTHEASDPSLITKN